MKTQLFLKKVRATVGWVDPSPWIIDELNIKEDDHLDDHDEGSPNRFEN